MATLDFGLRTFDCKIRGLTAPTSKIARVYCVLTG